MNMIRFMAFSTKTLSGILFVLIIFTCLLFVAGDTQAGAPTSNSLPRQIQFRFTASLSRILPGTSGEKAKGWNCNGRIKKADRIARLALVSRLYQNGCYTRGKYSHQNFPVKKGELRDANGNIRLEAYQISEAQKKASKFLGSRHIVFYKFPRKEDYVLYKFDGNSLGKLADIAASRIQTDRYIKIEEISASDIKGAEVFFFAPKSMRISRYTLLSRSVEGAVLATPSLGKVRKYRINVPAIPFDTRRDYTAGPALYANIYGHTKKFFPVVNPSGMPGVIWQGRKRGRIYLTSFANFRSSKTTPLPSSRDKDLAAATYDRHGALYYLLIQKRTCGLRCLSTRQAILYKVSQRGRLLVRRRLDTSKRGLDIASFGKSSIASLAHSNGRLGLIVARTKHRTPDGLNHQGAIAVLFDANTLRKLKNLGQTSGHSFDNELIVNERDEFIGLDLGDNYPRGLHLHKITRTRRHSRLVYTFKTAHQQKARSSDGRSYPLYREISRGSVRYYKWSNDNRTYTEQGGIVAGKAGYTIVFAGEPNRYGRSLDNSRARIALNDARNIGLLLIRKNFEKIRAYGSIIPDAMILTKGRSETGGFYTFGGSWSAQRNAGVVWLTSYRDKNHANASRVKIARLANGAMLLLWEKWTPKKYINTYAQKIDAYGKKLSEVFELGSQVRLGRTDELLVRGNKVYIFTGDRAAQKLEIVIIDVK